MASLRGPQGDQETSKPSNKLVLAQGTENQEQWLNNEEMRVVPGIEGEDGGIAGKSD